MTNKRLVMNESYRHWRNEMHHSWPIFKFKIIIIVNTQNPCYNNYCNRDFVVMSLVQLLYQWHHHTGSSRRKINAPFTLTDLPPEIFPFFFFFAGYVYQGQPWAGMIFEDVLPRVVETIFCIFLSTCACMYVWLNSTWSLPLAQARRGIQVVYDN